MAPQYKKCSSVKSRQKFDAGHGRITVPSNFGKKRYDNDKCQDVTNNDCPTGFKAVGGNGPFGDLGRKRTGGRGVPDSFMKTKQCWRGGNHHGRGSQAPWGMGHGVHGGYRWKSDEGRGSNNYAKICFKDAKGWQHTNPVNGNKARRNVQDNINACCGFKDSVKSQLSGNDKYCDPRYCFLTGGEHDQISLECSKELLKRCKNWSFVDDMLGFEDKRCASPLSQIANAFDTKISDLDSTQRLERDKVTAAISPTEYKNIGKRLCKVNDFLNIKSTNKVKKGKYKKCIEWCKNNKDGCSDIITEVCDKVYKRTKTFPDNFPNDIKDYEKICACNWPKEFYDKIEKYYKDTYKVNSVNTNRKCLFKPCNAAHIPYKEDNREKCPDTTFVSCVQNLEIDFRGSDIQGTVNVDAGQEQKCGSMAGTGAAATPASSSAGGSSAGGSSGGSGGSDEKSSKKEDDNTLLIVVVMFCCMMMMGGLGFALMNMNK